MSTETTVKQDQILEAAIKRFSHFGIAKTTLTELADDLGLTKQALSYYFHDKQSLITAVQEKIIADYINGLTAAVQNAPSLVEGLLMITRFRIGFFQKYYMLSWQADHSEHLNAKAVLDWKIMIRGKELELLEPLLHNGMETGELKPLDPAHTASLMLDMVFAFTRCVKDKGAFPTEDDFSLMTARLEEMTHIFYNGIKSSTWKN